MAKVKKLLTWSRMILITVGLICAIVGYVVADAIISRPILDCRMDAPDCVDVNSTAFMSQQAIRNRGGRETQIFIYVRMDSVTFRMCATRPIVVYETQELIILTTIPDDGRFVDFQARFHLQSNLRAFNVTFYVKTSSDWYNTLGEIHYYGITKLIYRKIGKNYVLMNHS